MKRTIVALTLIAAVGGVSGTAFAGDKDNGKSDNHNVCVVFANDQKYNDTTYYCVSTPNLP